MGVEAFEPTLVVTECEQTPWRRFLIPSAIFLKRPTQR
jgi:hypothetical protein